jgi:hypothetical protein
MRLSEIDPGAIIPGDKRDASYMVASGEDDLKDYIKQHCSDIVKLMKVSGIFLYRGVKNQSATVFVGQSRQDRQPKDTRQDISAYFDKALASHGFKALRGNSIFVTSNLQQAAGYGEAYAIFPMNGFDYTYTSMTDLIIRNGHLIEYPDNLIEDVSEWYNKNMGKFDNDKDSEVASKMHEIHWDVMSVQNISDRDPDASVHILNAKASLCQSLGQLANLGPQNSKVDTNDPFIQQFRSFDKSSSKNWSLDAAIKNLEPKNTDILVAMRQGREIFINGKYVAVRYDVTERGDLLDRLVGR